MYGIKLSFMSGPNDGLQIWLHDREGKGYAIIDGWQFMIGRREDSDLAIPHDTQVSRDHAVIKIHKGTISIEDNHSRNGTMVEHQFITQPTSLERGMFFRIGHTWLRLEDYTT